MSRPLRPSIPVRRLSFAFFLLAAWLSGGVVRAQEDDSQSFQFQTILRDVTGEETQTTAPDAPAQEAGEPETAGPETTETSPAQQIPEETQQLPQGQPAPEAEGDQGSIAPPTAPPPTTIIPMEDPPASFLDLPSVRLQTLDKATARTMTFEARVGSTVQFGPIFIKIRACRSPPPEEKKESAAFLQIWENDPKTGDPHWVFSGWMFASSPALSSMDHPIYDVWVVECIADAPQDKPESESPKPD